MTSLNPPCWIVSSSGANEENTEKQPVGNTLKMLGERIDIPPDIPLK